MVTEPKEEGLLTIKEICEVLRVPKGWVHSRTRRGQTGIPHLRVGKHLRFEKKKVLEFFGQSEA